jgi:hypothetical protein
MALARDRTAICNLFKREPLKSSAADTDRKTQPFSIVFQLGDEKAKSSLKFTVLSVFLTTGLNVI